MEKCRFLTQAGTCQIGQLALMRLDNPQVETLVGEVAVPNTCHVTPFTANGSAWAFFVPECVASEDAQLQRNCDSFVPKYAKSRAEWLSDFQEG